MNKHIPQPAIHVIDDDGLILGVGSKTPYPFFEGATLSIGPSGLDLVVSLTNPAKSEIRALKRGNIDLGMIISGGSAIALWRFASKKGPVILETPFHIGLLPPEDRWIPTATTEMETHTLLMIVQDEQCQCRALRLFSLPVNFSRTIEGVVEKQAEEALQAGWTRAIHERAVGRYFTTFQSPADAMKVCEQNAAVGGLNSKSNWSARGEPGA